MKTYMTEYKKEKRNGDTVMKVKLFTHNDL